MNYFYALSYQKFSENPKLISFEFNISIYNIAWIIGKTCHFEFFYNICLIICA